MGKNSEPKQLPAENQTQNFAYKDFLSKLQITWKSKKMCLNIMIMLGRAFICTKAGRFLKRRRIIKMKFLAFIAAVSAEYCYVCTSTKRVVKDTFNDERPSMSTDLDDCWKLRIEIKNFG